MRILRWISENTPKDRIWNKEICLKIGVVCIDEQMRGNCLRWFCHVQRRAFNVVVRKSESIQVERMKKSRGIY